MKRNIINLVILAIGLLILPSCANQKIVMVHEKYFDVAVSKRFVITKKTPVEDFNILKVSKSGVDYVGIYVGNHPNTDLSAYGTGYVVTSSKTGDREIKSVWKNGFLCHQAVLIELKNSSGWPAYIQAWTTDALSPDQLQEAFKILNTVNRPTH